MIPIPESPCCCITVSPSAYTMVECGRHGRFRRNEKGVWKKVTGPPAPRGPHYDHVILDEAVAFVATPTIQRSYNDRVGRAIDRLLGRKVSG